MELNLIWRLDWYKKKISNTINQNISNAKCQNTNKPHSISDLSLNESPSIILTSAINIPNCNKHPKSYQLKYSRNIHYK